MADFTITRVSIWPIDIPITDPFVVSTGRLTIAQNLFVRITLYGGATGFGEIAPFPAISGESRPASQEVALTLAGALVGQSVLEHHRLAALLGEMAPAFPAARCGLETALVDALCRQARIPLWGLWGGSQVCPRDTDITIPITTMDRSLELAHTWYQRGFRLFKTKVGMDLDEDIRRLERLHQALPDIAFIPDGNQGFTREGCAHFLQSVQRFGGTILLLEQPLSRDRLDDMAALRWDFGVSIAADESARSIDDLRDLLRLQAADFVNIKITKTGLHQALDMAAFARASRLRLMIGGMMETRVTMGCSFAMVLGLGGFEVLDLDTPLLMAEDPVSGGYAYSGPTLRPWQGPGLDLQLRMPETAITVG